MTTPLKSNPNSLPVTPVTTQKTPSCQICNDPSHAKYSCPHRNDFCPRCLRRDHKIVDCSFIRELCQICDQRGLGDLAFGHARFGPSLIAKLNSNFNFKYFVQSNTHLFLRKVHYETEKGKRDHIMRFISSECFPDWVAENNGKRKSFD